MATTMRAAVFQGKGKIALREVPRPVPGVGQALIKVTLTTICGTDVHILKGEYPVKEGLIVGHEPVGVIEELGPGVTGYQKGDRVIAGAITPCGQCRACLSGSPSQCGHGGDGYEAIGGWRFGNTIDGCQAEYVLVHDAQANLARIPAGLSDEEVLLCPDIMSTGFLRRRARSCPTGRRGGCVCAGADRALRDGWRAPGRCVAGDRRGQRAQTDGGRPPDGRRRGAQLQGAGRGRRDQAAHRRWRRRRDRGAGHVGNLRKLPCAACVRVARCRASASIPGISPCRSTPTRPGWGITPS